MASSKMAVLLFPEKQFIEVYCLGKDVIILDIHDTLEGGDILPSFALPVVNIGECQQGHFRAGNVLDAPEYDEVAVYKSNTVISCVFK